MGKLMKLELFSVLPSMPAGIQFLETLASNMWWSWNPDAIELFRRIDPHLWRSSGHSPQVFLNRVPQKRLEALSLEEGFLRHVDEVKAKFEQEVIKRKPRNGGVCGEKCIAYFSLEYGIHESLRIYSGGLGVLAGDHLKAASDLSLPMAAVGLLYRQGHYQQHLDRNGWQQEQYMENDVHLLPLQQVTGSNGEPLVISLPIPDGNMLAVIWRLNVGSVPLFLLDTNIPDNRPDIREITAKLYVVDRQTRLRQEILLGIGGYKALTAMGLEPSVCHINEGHAAFLSVGRLSHMLKERGLDLPAAIEIVQRTTVFTTHTPVPAGNETFPADLVISHMNAMQGELGIDPHTIVKWGQPDDPNAGYHNELSMTILGLRMAFYSNGVSKLHGKVARAMWKHLWPGKPEDEVPIGHVTNGIHVPSWLSPDNMALFRRYMGPDWCTHPASPDLLNMVNQIPDEELWHAHELRRSHMVRSVREWMEDQYSARNATRADVAQAKSVLDPECLTIGFARRFASYKRASLLLSDPDRFKAILSNNERPVQFIFAGKAHPADDHGKAIIRQIVQFATHSGVRRRLVFLENYNIEIARTLIQGVDVWMNTPRRPHEASGTSGMKAAVNGGLHLSTLDGWWCEGYSRDCGWAIGDGEVYDDPEHQDSVEAQALYNLLENDVIPKFYDRQVGDLPATWVKMMKGSIRMALGHFTSHRMVAEYRERFYTEAAQHNKELNANSAATARALVKQRERLSAFWKDVRVSAPTADRPVSLLHVGDSFTVRTSAVLGSLTPDEVDIEVYHGPVDSKNRIVQSSVQKMKLAKETGGGTYEYEHRIDCEHTGRYAFTCRASPAGRDWKSMMLGLITWSDGE